MAPDAGSRSSPRRAADRLLPVVLHEHPDGIGFIAGCRGGGRLGARLDADPDQAVREGDRLRCLADGQRGLDLVRLRVDTRDGAVEAVRDPDRAGAGCDPCRPRADRDRRRHRGGLGIEPVPCRRRCSPPRPRPRPQRSLGVPDRPASSRSPPLRCGSIRSTVLSASSASQMPPAPASMALGLFPTAIFSITPAAFAIDAGEPPSRPSHPHRVGADGDGFAAPRELLGRRGERVVCRAQGRVEPDQLPGAAARDPD